MNKAQIRTPRQQCFSFIEPFAKDFGGSLLVGQRKSKRPLSFKKPIHIVLKSTKAKGNLCFVNHLQKIEKTIDLISHQNQIKIYGKAVNFNHIHLVAQLSTEENYKAWIRLLPAEIANVVGAKGNFFDLRPFSTIVEWGRQYDHIRNYLILNQMEVFGIRPH